MNGPPPRRGRVVGSVAMAAGLLVLVTGLVAAPVGALPGAAARPTGTALGPEPLASPLEVGITLAPTTTTAGSTVRIEVVASGGVPLVNSTGGDYYILTVLFGDGGLRVLDTCNPCTVDHTYDRPGNYSVSAIAADGTSTTANATTRLWVRSATNPVVTDLEYAGLGAALALEAAAAVYLVRRRRAPPPRTSAPVGDPPKPS